jgi:hypothetical protein
MLMKKPGPWLATLVLLAFLTPPPAHAYNSREHQRLPDVAYQIMNLVRRGEFLVEKARQEVPPGQPPPQIHSVREVPDGVAADEWNRFLAEVESSPQVLDQLFTTLPDPANSSADCLHKFPILPPGQHLSTCRAGELPFAVERYWPGSRETDPTAALFTACRYRIGYSAGDPIRFPYVFSQMPSNFTGALLGYWAQNVDDGVDDIHMWFRPTNLAYVGMLRDVASKGVELGLTLILAPFACFISLFTGDNCLDEAQRLAREVEPIQLIDSAIPGVGDIDGDDIFDMTGVWHFINIDRAGRSDFNDIPGLKYTDGGYGDGFAGIGRIDAVDYTIIIASD